MPPELAGQRMRKTGANGYQGKAFRRKELMSVLEYFPGTHSGLKRDLADAAQWPRGRIQKKLL